MHVAVESEKCQEQACFRILSYFLPCLKGTDRPLEIDSQDFVLQFTNTYVICPKYIPGLLKKGTKTTNFKMKFKRYACKVYSL